MIERYLFVGLQSKQPSRLGFITMDDIKIKGQ
jgi:hypothetical protein